MDLFVQLLHAPYSRKVVGLHPVSIASYKTHQRCIKVESILTAHQQIT